MKKYIFISFVLGLFAGIGGSVLLLRTAMRDGGFFGSIPIGEDVVTTKTLVLVQDEEICRLPIGTILTAESSDDITRLSIAIGLDNEFVNAKGGVYEVLPKGDNRSSFSHLYPADN